MQNLALISQNDAPGDSGITLQAILGHFDTNFKYMLEAVAELQATCEETNKRVRALEQRVGASQVPSSISRSDSTTTDTTHPTGNTVSDHPGHAGRPSETSTRQRVERGTSPVSQDSRDQGLPDNFLQWFGLWAAPQATQSDVSGFPDKGQQYHSEGLHEANQPAALESIQAGTSSCSSPSEVYRGLLADIVDSSEISPDDARKSPFPCPSSPLTSVDCDSDLEEDIPLLDVLNPAVVSSSKTTSSGTAIIKKRKRSITGQGRKKSSAKRARKDLYIPNVPWPAKYTEEEESNQFYGQVIFCDRCALSFHYGCVGIHPGAHKDAFSCPFCQAGTRVKKRRGRKPAKHQDTSKNPENVCHRPDCVPDTDEFFVDALLGRRRIGKGDLQYLVSWHGYDIKESKWYPEKEITDTALVQEFIEAARKQSLNVDFEEDILLQQAAGIFL